MADTVNVTKENQLCYIGMNQPEKRNALSPEVVDGIVKALNDAEQDDDVLAVILYGEGKAFCSGGDIDTMGKNASPADSIRYMEGASSLTRTIVNLDKFVISAVHGFAAGAGFSLALASDFVIADKQTKFVSSFRNIGLVPDLGLIKQLSENVPAPVAKEWIASGQPVSAETMHAYGLVNRLTDENDVISQAASFAHFIVEGPPFSNKFVKYLFNHADEFSLDSSIMQESIMQSLMFYTDDAKEGIQAFLEKRSPDFKGK